MSPTASAQATSSDMIATCMVAGVELVLDPSGALFIPMSRTVVFSDLHFEKGSSYGRRGLFLPPFDTRATLKQVARIIAQYQPEQVISLGDAFHDGDAEARMSAQDAELLSQLVAAQDWLWVLGNHDPKPPARFGGSVSATHMVEGLVLCHQPEVCPTWNLVGHFHPVAKIVSSGRGVRRKCFVSDGTRMIMPSFGAFTGGLNILDAAYDGLLVAPLTVQMLGKEAVYQVSAKSLRPDGGDFFRRR